MCEFSEELNELNWISADRLHGMHSLGVIWQSHHMFYMLSPVCFLAIRCNLLNEHYSVTQSTSTNFNRNIKRPSKNLSITF